MCEVNRCKGNLPRFPSPRTPYADEGHDGAVRAPALSGYQIDRCVRNDYPPVFAQGRNLEQLAVQLTGLHRLIEPPPMHGPECGRDHHVQTSPQGVVRRMTHDIRDCITPLMDDALAVDGHGGAVMGRLGSVHKVITTATVAGFTDAPTRSPVVGHRPGRYM